jgi:hypothetical protein
MYWKSTRRRRASSTTGAVGGGVHLRVLAPVFGSIPSLYTEAVAVEFDVDVDRVMKSELHVVE